MVFVVGKGCRAACDAVMRNLMWVRIPPNTPKIYSNGGIGIHMRLRTAHTVMVIRVRVSFGVQKEKYASVMKLVAHEGLKIPWGKSSCVFKSHQAYKKLNFDGGMVYADSTYIICTWEYCQMKSNLAADRWVVNKYNQYRFESYSKFNLFFIK